MQAAITEVPRHDQGPVVPRKHPHVLYIAASAAAFSAIAYELLLASYATFLLGATIFQYSLVISLMMASMGGGALVTAKIEQRSLDYLLGVELTLSWIALLAMPVLYYAFAINLSPGFFLIVFVLAIGLGIGMEIPLINYMVSQVSGAHQGLARVLFCDYLGGFLGGLAFPLWLQPKLGFFQIAGLLATMNALVAGGLLLFERRALPSRNYWLMATLLTMVASLVFVGYAEPLRQRMELGLFQIQALP